MIVNLDGYHFKNAYMVLHWDALQAGRAPADYGVTRIGHEGAFRRGMERLWDEMFDWLVEPTPEPPR